MHKQFSRPTLNPFGRIKSETGGNLMNIKSIALTVFVAFNVVGCQQPVVEFQSFAPTSSKQQTRSVQNQTTITCRSNSTGTDAVTDIRIEAETTSQMRCQETSSNQVGLNGPNIPRHTGKPIPDARDIIVWNGIPCDLSKILTIPCTGIPPTSFSIVGFPKINWPEIDGPNHKSTGSFVSISVLNSSNTPTLGGSDQTPPSISFQINASSSNAPESHTQASIVWVLTDNESPITSSSHCEAFTLSTNLDLTLTCIATSQGGKASQTVSIKSHEYSSQ
jgi:hypothetical protein